MRWFVDGMNVIGSRPTGWWHDRTGAMRELGEDSGPVEVVFAPGGRNAADDEIARRVEEDGRPAELRVVTSDRDLSTRVRARGAEVVGAGGFRVRLDELG